MLSKIIENKIKRIESNSMYPAYGLNSQVMAYKDILPEIKKQDELMKEMLNFLEQASIFIKNKAFHDDKISKICLNDYKKVIQKAKQWNEK